MVFWEQLKDTWLPLGNIGGHFSSRLGRQQPHDSAIDRDGPDSLGASSPGIGTYMVNLGQDKPEAAKTRSNFLACFCASSTGANKATTCW